jgi:hypothetical protein
MSVRYSIASATDTLPPQPPSFANDVASKFMKILLTSAGIKNNEYGQF